MEEVKTQYLITYSVLYVLIARAARSIIDRHSSAFARPVRLSFALRHFVSALLVL